MLSGSLGSAQLWPAVQGGCKACNNRGSTRTYDPYKYANGNANMVSRSEYGSCLMAATCRWGAVGRTSTRRTMRWSGGATGATTHDKGDWFGPHHLRTTLLGPGNNRDLPFSARMFFNNACERKIYSVSIRNKWAGSQQKRVRRMTCVHASKCAMLRRRKLQAATWDARNEPA